MLHRRRDSHSFHRFTTVLLALASGLYALIFMSLGSNILEHTIPSLSTQKYSFNPLLRALGFTSDTMYEKILLNKGISGKNSNLAIIEVGADNLTQSVFAAKAGFNVIIFNASPHDTREMKKERRKLPEDVRNRIIIHNMAAFERSKQKLKFSAIDGTADHVSSIKENSEKTVSGQFPNLLVKVETIALDDVITLFPKNKYVYLLKIDVHGHETDIFSGLQNSLVEGKVRYILFEYWVDVLDQSNRLPLGSCYSVSSILGRLSNAGYELFDLNVQNHAAGDGMKPENKESYLRPLDFYDHCKWFHRKSEEAREGLNYTRGYWTDILAVYKGEFLPNELF